MINNLNFQESNYRTVEIKQNIKRPYKEITHYQEFQNSRQQYQATKAKRIQYVKLKKNNNQYVFPCYNDQVITFPPGLNELIKERQQDDDNESDDEIIFSSIQFQIKNLANALSDENKKKYTIKQIIKSDFSNTFFD